MAPAEHPVNGRKAGWEKEMILSVPELKTVGDRRGKPPACGLALDRVALAGYDGKGEGRMVSERNIDSTRPSPEGNQTGQSQPVKGGGGKGDELGTSVRHQQRSGRRVQAGEGSGRSSSPR